MSYYDNPKAFMELSRRDPMFFRENIILDGPKGEDYWGNFMAEFQRKDFAAFDPALLSVSKQAPPGMEVPYRLFYVQRGRGSSKTTDLASNIIWLCIFAKLPLSMTAVAEDKEQAEFIRNQALEILSFNPWMKEYIEVQKKAIVGKSNGARLDSLSKDTASSYGLTSHVIIADEWSHWTQQEMWSSIWSTYEKRGNKGGIMFVSCNAGKGRDWKYETRQNLFQTDPSWYYSAPEGCAPWYTEEQMKRQRKGLHASEFDRLWMNRWQESDGGFVSLTEASRCVNEKLTKRSETEQEGWVYVAAIDYAEKIDRTVGVVGHRYGEKIIVDRMDVIDPKAYGVESVQLDMVETWMRDVDAQFGSKGGAVEFVVDKHQMLGIMQRLRNEGFWVEEFEFKSGIGNYEIGLILRQLIIHQRVEWYPNCGEILTADGEKYLPDNRDDLVTELASLERKDIAGGSRWRFDHPPGGHDDRAFALGALCRHIIMNSGDLEEWNITPPSGRGKFSMGEF